MSSTFIWFCVNVPVLSVQITVVGHAPVFEDQIDDPVFAGEQLEVVLVGAELLGLGHLGLLGMRIFPKSTSPSWRAELMFRFMIFNGKYFMGII